MQAQRKSPVRQKKTDWAHRIKNLLIHVTLYQYGKYDGSKLNRELTSFLKDAEKMLCKAIRRNGGICYREALYDMSPEEAREFVESMIWNYELDAKYGQRWVIPMIHMLKLSLKFEGLEKKSLREKILLFDEVVHAVHAAGAYDDFTPEEQSIFGVNIPAIKEEAERELRWYLD